MNVMNVSTPSAPVCINYYGGAIYMCSMYVYNAYSATVRVPCYSWAEKKSSTSRTAGAHSGRVATINFRVRILVPMYDLMTLSIITDMVVKLRHLNMGVPNSGNASDTCM